MKRLVFLLLSLFCFQTRAQFDLTVVGSTLLHPTNFPETIEFWEADTDLKPFLAHGASVALWTNVYGSILSQGTASRQPVLRTNGPGTIRGKACVKFDGTDDGLFTKSNTLRYAGTTYTMFGVLSNNISTLCFDIAQSNTLNQSFLCLDGSAYHHTSSGVNWQRLHQFQGRVGWQYFFHSFGADTNTMTNRIDGINATGTLTKVGTPIAYTNLPRVVSMGQRANGGGGYAPFVACFGIMEGVPNKDVASQIEQWIRLNYGLSLP